MRLDAAYPKKIRYIMRDSINNLVHAISRAENAFNERALATITSLLDELHSRQQEVERSGVDQLKFDGFSQVADPSTAPEPTLLILRVAHSRPPAADRPQARVRV
jgi:hypothetical protein